MKNNNVDKIIYNAPTVRESIKLASETPQEETELMLLQEALQDEDYRRWKKRNPGGTFRDYLDDFKPKKIKLKQGGIIKDPRFDYYSNGGAVEKYEDLIDAYEKGIDVKKNETLTDYIKRIRAAEKDQ
jgi:hypothetical protein|tara:strand:+ start:67 stop:450 length:384 start_codon:yes stop_codon:yes gene_type:complete